MRRHERGWWTRVMESVESRLWPVPLAVVVFAVALGILFPLLDRVIEAGLPAVVAAALFNGGADTARTVLSSIAGSLITATSLTFSLTVVSLQLASSQASPRMLRLFARDRQVHWTLATFLGTFAYSITVLRSVKSATQTSPAVVPQLSVTVAFLLTLVSVIMLIFFLAHLAALLRVETMLKDIHADADRTIELRGLRNSSVKAFNAPIVVPAVTEVVMCESNGFLTTQDRASLVSSAVKYSIVIKEVRQVGDNVVRGTPLAYWWSDSDERKPGEAERDEIAEAIRCAYSTGYERKAADDEGLGVEQILDIGLRALSPGINDPTTAVNALGHLAAMLAGTVSMPRMPAGIADDDGQLRVVVVPRTASDDIEAALSPFRQYGAEHQAVVKRLVRLADELSAAASNAEVDRALVEQLEALIRQLRTHDEDPATRDALVTLTEGAVGRIEQRLRSNSE